MRILFRPLVAAWLVATIGGCGDAAVGTDTTARLISDGTTCALDGMLLAHFPGPKAQIHYDGSAEPDFFCDTVEMFALLLKPEQARIVRAVYVQDMAQADWDKPRGHWIDARQAFYVIGADRPGSMGPTIASFAAEADATGFAGRHGGKVLRFAQVTPDMVVLDGGVLRDQKM